MKLPLRVDSRLPNSTLVAGQIDAEAGKPGTFEVAEVLSGLHVLVVDDDEDTLELLSAALTQRSANVTARVVSSRGPRRRSRAPGPMC